LFDEVCPRILDASCVIVQLDYLFVEMVIIDSGIFIRLAKAASLPHGHTSVSKIAFPKLNKIISK